MSQILQIVGRAITENLKGLVYTAILGVIIQFIYAVWAFITPIYKDFNVDGCDANCNSLGICFASSLTIGLSEEGFTNIL